MKDKDYIDGLKKLQIIYKQIEAVGMMAAIQHRGTLEKLAPQIVEESIRRAELEGGKV